MENTTPMIDLIKRATLLSAQFLVMTKGANMQSDSEFELSFPMSAYDELREELELKTAIELFSLTISDGRALMLQDLKCVEIHKTKKELEAEKATEFKADFLGVVMNRKEFRETDKKEHLGVTYTTYSTLK
jgi:hypothetical protein